MGIALPGAGGATRQSMASGAQVIDGSLTFDANSKNYLKRTFSSGNRTTWTLSVWVKRNTLAATHTDQTIFEANGSNNDNDYILIKFRNATVSDSFNISGSSTNFIITNQQFRDVSSWYNLVVSANTGEASADRLKVYVNGERISSFNTYNAPSGNTGPNGAVAHHIGHSVPNDQAADVNMSQFYFIDGQALGPEYFGFTDPLTNTWRPKKFSGNFTQTSFNNGTTWSSSLTSNGTLQNAGNAFDGDLSSRAQTQSPAADKTLTFSPPAINFTQKLEVYCDQGSAVPTATWNGNTVNPGGGAWVTVYTGSGTLSSTYPLVIDTETASQYATLKGVRIDGEVLIDGLNGSGVNSFYLPMDGNSPIGDDKSGQGNNWTPVNFGGSVALPKATGAKPILNTDGGGNVARPGVFGSELNQTIAVTVSNASGNNKYYLDGSLTPNLAFTRGSTITFNTGDSTGNGHPFKLSSTNASGSGGTEYTDGVAYYINGSVVSGSDYVTNYSSGAASGFRGIKWTVPHNQSTTYYYCTIHTGMGNNGAFTSTIDETKADPYAWKNVLATPLVGSANDVSNQINSGSTTKTITANGGAAASSAASNFYNGSFIFDGSGDYLSSSSSSDLSFGTGNFTIECWVYQTSAASAEDGIFQISTTSGGLAATQSNTITLQTNGSVYRSYANDTSTAFSTAVITNKWVHLALVRSSTSLNLFVNGVKDATTISDSRNYSGTYLAIGGYYSTSYLWVGNISDLRVYKGVAKYTSNFVVPATSPDILPDTPSGVSGGSKLTKITDGAVSFDGTGDYLTVGSSSDFTMGTGDFTVECFLTKSAQEHKGVFQISDTSGGLKTSGLGGTIALGYQSGVWQIYGGGGETTAESSSYPIGVNKWYHLAYVRSSGVSKLYVDGVQVISLSDTTDYNTTYMAIGGYYNTSYLHRGFISNLRVIKGTALYTSNFTPPSSAPLTNVTNTKLLCCQSNTSATEGAVKPGTITANGDAAATNFNPFNTDINTVRGQETGYPTMNPNAKNSSIVLSDGNLNIASSGSHGDKKIVHSTAKIPNGGKWFVEWTVGGGAATLGFGKGYAVSWAGSDTQIGATSDSWGYEVNGSLFHNGSLGGSFPGPSAGDVIGMTIDTSGATLTAQWYKNGILLKNGSNIAEFTGVALGDYIVMMSQHSPNYDTQVNFGQKPFKFPPPAGFQPLNDANVRPETVITRPDQFVGVTTYTGNGGTQSIETGHKFDFVWIKTRSGTGDHHLFDVVRGVNKSLHSNSTSGTETTTAGLTAFNSNGFSIGNSNNDINGNDITFVSWNWKAGGNKNTFNVDDVGYASASDVNMSVGSLNSAVYNTSAIWSGMMSGPSNSGSYTSLFDGTDGDAGGYEQPTDGNTLTFTPTGGITATSSIEIYAYQSASTYAGSADITVNGSSIKTGAVQSALGTGAAGGYVNIGTTSLTTLTWSNPSGSNNDYRLMAIKVDGKILVDSNQTPPNAPSIAVTGASVNTKSKFGIYTWNGHGSSNETLAHGLGAKPDFMICKKKSTSGNNWVIWHKSIGTTQYLMFATNAVGTDATLFNSHTNDSDNLWSLGTNSSISDTGQSAVAYLWCDVPGLQKFGSYTGNNNADGPFIELGFKPSVLMVKRTAGANANWYIMDKETQKINPVVEALEPNTSDSTNTASVVNFDFLSNGFKVRGTDGDINATNIFIYAAWAEAPSFNLFGAQSNAR